jgi:hypothetical protein
MPVRGRSSVALLLVAAIAFGVIARPSREEASRTDVLGETAAQRIDMGFPVGWYDSLARKSALPQIALEGMDAVMPYYTRWSDVGPYLDAAAAADVRVFFEFPRDIVRNVDTATIASIVSSLSSDETVAGWYLADEPTINEQLGPLSAASAATLYDTIKANDPDRPVAIAFTTGETAASYAAAMDVMMFDDYPCADGTAEFSTLRGWTSRLDAAAAAGANEGGFVPVIQAYGGAFNNRLPTAREERYMAYAAVQRGATGLFFWTHYRTDPAWVETALVPITRELRKLQPALAAGAKSGLTLTDHREVRTTVFRDPTTNAVYLIVTHNGDGTVRPRITFTGGLARARAVAILGSGRARAVTNRRFTTALGSYGVRVFRVF